jgi:hypothetical protein
VLPASVDSGDDITTLTGVAVTVADTGPAAAVADTAAQSETCTHAAKFTYSWSDGGHISTCGAGRRAEREARNANTTGDTGATATDGTAAAGAAGGASEGQSTPGVCAQSLNQLSSATVYHDAAVEDPDPAVEDPDPAECPAPAD